MRRRAGLAARGADAERAALRARARDLAAHGHDDVSIACRLMVRWELVRDWLEAAADDGGAGAPPLPATADGAADGAAEDRLAPSVQRACIACGHVFHTRTERARCAACA